MTALNTARDSTNSSKLAGEFLADIFTTIPLNLESHDTEFTFSNAFFILDFIFTGGHWHQSPAPTKHQSLFIKRHYHLDTTMKTVVNKNRWEQPQ